MFVHRLFSQFPCSCLARFCPMSVDAISFRIACVTSVALRYDAPPMFYWRPRYLNGVVLQSVRTRNATAETTKEFVILLTDDACRPRWLGRRGRAESTRCIATTVSIGGDRTEHTDSVANFDLHALESRSPHKRL